LGIFSAFAFFLSTVRENFRRCNEGWRERVGRLIIAAPPELVAIADLVTDMRPIKQPYGDGVRAQKGVEF
jgi:hypothetical protein